MRKREQKVRDREERRNLKRVKRRQDEEQRKLQLKIATEERRLLLAQRNLESIRLIAELLARAKVGGAPGGMPGLSAPLDGWIDRNFINPWGRFPQEIALPAAANTTLENIIRAKVVNKWIIINVQKYKMQYANHIYAGKR